MKLNLNTGLSALPKIGGGSGPAPFPNTKSTEFDGVDDYITTSTLSSLVDNKSKLSISLWLKLPDAGETNRITGKYAGSLNKWLAINCTADKVSFVVSGTITAPSESLAYGITGAVLTDNTWHHIVCVFDGTQGVNNDRGKIYVDNTDEALTYNNSFPSATYDFSTEGSPPNWDLARTGYVPTSNELRGNMDEYAIYSDVALTPTMVGEIFNSGTPANLNSLATTPNPDLWYRMGDSAVFNADSQWEFPEQTKIDNFSSHSFEFDGVNDYIIAPLDGTTTGGILAAADTDVNLTISLWFKLSTSVATQGILSWAASLNNGTPLIIIQQNSLDIRVYVDSTYQTATTIVLDTWYNIVVIRDSTTNIWTGYINGVSFFTYDDSGSFSGRVGATDIYLGNGYNGYIAGNIDGVSVWDEALTSGNVTSIYNSGVPNDVSGLSISGLVGYWRMGEGATFSTNWTIPDVSTNSNDGTSANMDEADNVNTAPDNENQGLSVGMVSGSVVTDVPT